jgi:fructokinase
MSRVVYGIGEVVFDIIFKRGIPVDGKPGGAILNSLVSLSRLKVDTTLIADCVNDSVGKLIENFLVGNNVNVDSIKWYNTGRSRLALAFLNTSNDADYLFYKMQSEENLNLNYPIPVESDIILFGSYYGIKPEIRNGLTEFLNKASIAGNCIVYDPNFRKSHLSMLEQVRPFIYENFKISDIVKGSSEDFYYIFNEKSPQEIYRKFVECGGKILVLTSAEKSVWLFHPDFSFQVKVPEINPISTIGAGDSFSAGVIYGLISNNIAKQDIKNLDESVWLQIINSAIKCAISVCMSYENYVPQNYNLALK